MVSCSGGHITVKSRYAIFFIARNAAVRLHAHNVRRILRPLLAADRTHAAAAAATIFTGIPTIATSIAYYGVLRAPPTFVMNGPSPPPPLDYQYFVRQRPCNRNAETVVAAIATPLPPPSPSLSRWSGISILPPPKHFSSFILYFVVVRNYTIFDFKSYYIIIIY